MILALKTLQALLALLFFTGGVQNLRQPGRYKLQSPSDVQFFIFQTLSEILFSALFVWLLFLRGPGHWPVYLGLVAAVVTVWQAWRLFLKKEGAAVWGVLGLSLLSGLVVWGSLVTIQ